MAVWAKIVAVFGKIFWGGFWRVWAPKVAVSDFDLLETLLQCCQLWRVGGKVAVWDICVAGKIFGGG